MDKRIDMLARLAGPAALAKLSGAGFDWTPVDAAACAAARFRRLAGDAPAIVGLVGGASSGKSTLFNSLVRRELSRISAHAHETLGPVIAIHHERFADIEAQLRSEVMLPGLTPTFMTDGAATIGHPGGVCAWAHHCDDLRLHILMDTPDVTSEASAAEGAVARSLLPWFDGLVIVVDEERWFDATVFDDILGLSRELGPSCCVVFNQTDASEAFGEADWKRLRDHAAARGTDHACVSLFQPGVGYRPVADETRHGVVEWAGSLDVKRRSRTLERYIHGRCGEALRLNVSRTEQFTTLRRTLDDALTELTSETNLSTDLLTADERELLGLPYRYVPLYGALRWLRRRLRSGGQRPADAQIDFAKRTEQLAEVLRRNLEHRFRHATDRLTRLLREGPYLADAEQPWTPEWAFPAFDERHWAARIRAHIDAWTAEAQKQSRQGDVVALAVGAPLLLADLLFLGGAGVTLSWAAAWVTGFVGGKGLSTVVQKSSAFGEYQTTVRAYRSFLREALSEQCERNLAAMPFRHLKMTDPLLEAIMHWSITVRH